MKNFSFLICTRKKVFYILFFSFLFSCTIKQEKKEVSIIADVGGKTLTRESLLSMTSESFFNKEDSLKIVSRQTKDWIIKELIYHEAKSKLDREELYELDEQVEEYKNKLYSYHYLGKYIEKKLDSNVTLAELKRNYEKNLIDYTVSFDIVNLVKITVPVNSNPKFLRGLKKLLMLKKESDTLELKRIIKENQVTFKAEFDIWTSAEKFKEVINSNDISENKIYKIKDTKNQKLVTYYKVLGVKIKGETSPLGFIRKYLKKIIINKRKQKIIFQYKEQLYEKGLQSSIANNYLND